MDDGAAVEDHTPGTPELKRTYLSLISHSALVDLVLAVDAGNGSIFPSDLRGEVRRMQSNTADDADGEGSPDPQPVPTTTRAPSVPPAGGPRTRAGAARAYAAALASKDAASARPSPAPGGISFPQTPEPQPQPQPQTAFAPIPQPYPSLVVHLPDGSPPAPAPATPTTPAPGPPPGAPWQSPESESNGPGPIRNTPAKKTRTGVIGGYNPITSIGPSAEGLPSYEEMIVLALMENQDGLGIAPKDVFAWMSARWPLNANFRPSASQALQKAFKRGRLEKIGTKYKLNPNWHGGATTNRTTRRPQSMAELPGNYAWAPPPVPPVTSVPPDPRLRSNPPSTPAPATQPGQPSGQSAEFDAQAQVASLLKALQDQAGPSNVPNGAGQNQQPSPVAAPLPPPPPVDGTNPQVQVPHITLPQTVPGVTGQMSPTTPVAVGSPTVAIPLQHPIPQPAVPVPVSLQAGLPPQPPPQQNPVPPGHPLPLAYPPYHPAPTALQASLATLASQLASMSKNNQST